MMPLLLDDCSTAAHHPTAIMLITASQKHAIMQLLAGMNKLLSSSCIMYASGPYNARLLPLLT